VKGRPFVFLALVAFAGCGGEDTASELASVRGLNFATGVGTVRFANDFDTIGNADEGTWTPYVAVAAVNQDIYAGNAGGTIGGELWEPAAKSRWTVAVHGRAGSGQFPLRFRVFTDAQILPPNSETMLRLFHASTRYPGGVDVYVTPVDATLTDRQPLISNISYGTMSPYRSVPVTVDSIRIRVTPTGAKTPVLADMTPVASAGGQTRTLALFEVGAGSRVDLLSDRND
jgi:hypothetical protein